MNRVGDFATQSLREILGRGPNKLAARGKSVIASVAAPFPGVARGPC
jgi:hypothetical protein